MQKGLHLLAFLLFLIHSCIAAENVNSQDLDQVPTASQSFDQSPQDQDQNLNAGRRSDDLLIDNNSGPAAYEDNQQQTFDQLPYSRRSAAVDVAENRLFQGQTFPQQFDKISNTKRRNQGLYFDDNGVARFEDPISSHPRFDQPPMVISPPRQYENPYFDGDLTSGYGNQAQLYNQDNSANRFTPVNVNDDTPFLFEDQIKSQEHNQVSDAARRLSGFNFIDNAYAYGDNAQKEGDKQEYNGANSDEFEGQNQTAVYNEVLNAVRRTENQEASDEIVSRSGDQIQDAFDSPDKPDSDIRRMGIPLDFGISLGGGQGPALFPGFQGTSNLNNPGYGKYIAIGNHFSASQYPHNSFNPEDVHSFDSLSLGSVSSRVILQSEYILPHSIPGAENSLYCAKEGELHYLSSSTHKCLVCSCIRFFGTIEPVCVTCAGCGSISKIPETDHVPREQEIAPLGPTQPKEEVSCSPLPLNEPFQNPLNPCQICVCSKMINLSGKLDIQVKCEESPHCVMPPGVKPLRPQFQIPANGKKIPDALHPDVTPQELKSDRPIPSPDFAPHRHSITPHIKHPEPLLPSREPFTPDSSTTPNLPVVSPTKNPLPWPPVVPSQPLPGPLPGSKPHKSCRPYPPNQYFLHPWDSCQICICNEARVLGIVYVEVYCHTRQECQCVDEPQTSMALPEVPSSAAISKKSQMKFIDEVCRFNSIGVEFMYPQDSCRLCSCERFAELVVPVCRRSNQRDCTPDAPLPIEELIFIDNACKYRPPNQQIAADCKVCTCYVVFNYVISRCVTSTDCANGLGAGFGSNLNKNPNANSASLNHLDIVSLNEVQYRPPQPSLTYNLDGVRYSDLSSATHNTMAGYNTMAANTMAGHNTMAGYNNMPENTMAGHNTMAGYNTMAANTMAGHNTMAGYNTMAANTMAGHNTMAGYNNMPENTMAGHNTMAGYNTMPENTMAGHNTMAGYNTMPENTMAGHNTMAGYNTMPENTMAGHNTMAGYNTMAGHNTLSGHSTVAGYNTMPGQDTMAGYNNMASQNSQLIYINKQPFSQSHSSMYHHPHHSVPAHSILPTIGYSGYLIGTNPGSIRSASPTTDDDVKEPQDIGPQENGSDSSQRSSLGVGRTYKYDVPSIIPQEEVSFSNAGNAAPAGLGASDLYRNLYSRPSGEKTALFTPHRKSVDADLVSGFSKFKPPGSIIPNEMQTKSAAPEEFEESR